jgi:hypothetical protein
MANNKVRLTINEISLVLSLLADLTDEEIEYLELDDEDHAVVLKLRSAMNNSQTVLLPGYRGY